MHNYDYYACEPVPYYKNDEECAYYENKHKDSYYCGWCNRDCTGQLHDVTNASEGIQIEGFEEFFCCQECINNFMNDNKQEDILTEENYPIAYGNYEVTSLFSRVI